MTNITIKDLFNSLSPEIQDEVKFAYAQLLENTGEYTDNIEDIALWILTSSNSPVNDVQHRDKIKKYCTKFFYYWYNTKGTNTEQGFDEWWNIKGNKLKNEGN